MLRGQKVVERGLGKLSSRRGTPVYLSAGATGLMVLAHRESLHVPSVNTAVSIEIEKECMQQKMLCST